MSTIVDKETKDDKNGISNEIYLSLLNWSKHITKINLSGLKLDEIPKTVSLPTCLTTFNLSHNLFNKVPDIVLTLQHLINLNLSHNNIMFFDETPAFCHTIVDLNLANNSLHRPPLWIWDGNPKKLENLNISNNSNITTQLTDGEKELLLTCTVKAKTVKIHNCRLSGFKKLFATLREANTLSIGIDDDTVSMLNNVEEFPCEGLAECHDIENLNLSNVKMYTVSPSINIYKSLKEINLSVNKINNLPIEFCTLAHLETCILSRNELTCIPNEFVNLSNLKRLHLQDNKLCVLPEGLCSLPHLDLLDVYNNTLDSIPNDYSNINKVDFAQNFIEEPDDSVYIDKKINLRVLYQNSERIDGRKAMVILNDERLDSDEHEDSIDKETPPYLVNNAINVSNEIQEEDWDCDDDWEPQRTHLSYIPQPAPSHWITYVEHKMAEGAFCPMDQHTVPIVDKIKWHWQSNLWRDTLHECEGQFDSSDES